MLYFILINIFSVVDGSSENMPQKERLISRIESFYNNWKENKYEICWGFFLKESGVLDKESFVNNFKQMPSVDKYKIISFEMKDDTVKVKMSTNLIENGKDLLGADISYDYWIFKNNEWYLYDFFKIK